MSENHDPTVTEGATAERGAGDGCPVVHGLTHPTQGDANSDWWPNKLNLKILAKNPAVANPLGEEFNYKDAFLSLDLAAVKRDIAEVLTTSKDWWPADFGNYGPLMIRMAWHSAGTYRISDGRGGGGAGQQRFAPLNSWPDNVSLDKARRLLWPVKQKYGQKISWADLMILTGNVALESMGFKTFGFAGGREDVWEPEDDVYWGPETTWLDDQRYSGDRELANPLGAVQMGLIYVNPEGPNGNPDPLAAARDIRETFAPHGDERRGDGRADRRRPHLRQDPRRGPDAHTSAASPEARRSRSRVSAGRTPSAPAWATTRSPAGWRSSGPTTPTKWDNEFFEILFGYEWELTKSPAGAHQWRPKDRRRRHGARRPRRVQAPRPDDADDRPLAALRPGLRADLATLPGGPGPVRRRLRPGLVQAHPPRHGPVVRYLGPESPTRS